ncbi:hypothetical protein ABZP36_001291 [Zizania latifolia]
MRKATLIPSTHPALRHLRLHLAAPSLATAKQIHGHALYAGNSLIRFYDACGPFESAHRVFDEIPQCRRCKEDVEMGLGRTVVSWTSLIVGLVVNGFGRESLELFSVMERKKLVPTEITMLGRAGRVEEAYHYITTMPSEPNAVVWRTLLDACAMDRKLELGKVSWAQLVELDLGYSGNYVLLSNLYAAVGRWADQMFMCLGRQFSAAGVAQQEKVEPAMPIPTLSPPEGNTTFVDGVTWCVARPGVSQEDLQNALDWACGQGGADCTPLQPGGRCYQPDTLLSHASYAFNIFYQQNGNSDIACNFGGAGTIIKRDPSFGPCKFLASETASCCQSTCGGLVLFVKDYFCKEQGTRNSATFFV